MPMPIPMPMPMPIPRSRSRSRPSRSPRPVAHAFSPFAALCCGLCVLSLLTGCEASARGAAVPPTPTPSASSAPSATISPTATPQDQSPFLIVRAIRLSAFPENKVPAFDTTAIDRNQNLYSVYQAIQALPPYPQNMYCRANHGIAYQLSFVRLDGTSVSVVAAIGGCEAVTIEGSATRSALGVSGFWDTLAAALGVPTNALVEVPIPGTASGQFAPAEPPTATTGPAGPGPFVRLRAVRDNGLASAPRFDATVKDPAKIMQLYAAITALKPYPLGAVPFCPIDQGVLYQLTFTRADGTTFAGFAKPDGCRWAGFAYDTTATVTVGQITGFVGFWSIFGAVFGVAESTVGI